MVYVSGFCLLKGGRSAGTSPTACVFTPRRAAMALVSKLSGDEQRIVFGQLCNVLEPRVAVAFCSTSNELREPTLALLQQLKADYETAVALCLRVGMSCKQLREARTVDWRYKGFSEADLTLLGTLGSVLPALEVLILLETSATAAGPDGMQRLAAGLGAGALPAVTWLRLSMHVGDAGASALAAALGRGAMPRLKLLNLTSAGIGDAALVALALALRRLPALESLRLSYNPLGDEGLAALVVPPPTTGALSPPIVVLTMLKRLILRSTQITDTGCATLASALDSGALPALDWLNLDGIPASVAAIATCMRLATR